MPGEVTTAVGASSGSSTVMTGSLSMLTFPARSVARAVTEIVALGISMVVS